MSPSTLQIRESLTEALSYDSVLNIQLTHNRSRKEIVVVVGHSHEIIQAKPNVICRIHASKFTVNAITYRCAPGTNSAPSSSRVSHCFLQRTIWQTGNDSPTQRTRLGETGTDTPHFNFLVIKSWLCQAIPKRANLNADTTILILVRFEHMSKT